MRVAGIIAEYNPFHSGHELLIRRAREGGATHIVAVMSGNFVQRGGPAIFHHSVRTAAALAGGVDLVLQLPSVYAVSPAQSFARAGVSILDGLGCVDKLVFGSECGDIEKIAEAARAVYSESIEPLLASELEKGVSFAAARENALRRLCPACADIIKNPNDILGVEYVAALERAGSKMKPVTFCRVGAKHDSDVAEQGIASASYIRESVKNGSDWSAFVPKNTADIYSAALERDGFADIAGIERAILFSVRTAGRESLALAPDISEGIENRIIAAAKDAASLEELYMLAKTKRYSHARIRRIILNYFLGVTAEDAKTPVPYAKIMGFSPAGAQLIRAAKGSSNLPIITKAADIGALGDAAQRIFTLECRAGDIFALCLPKIGAGGSEKSGRPIII